MLKSFFEICVLIGVICPLTSGPLQALEPEDAKLKKLAADSRARAERIEVSVGEPSRKPELHPDPLIQYTDPPRAIEIATLWIWQEGGHPVALVKVEAHRQPEGAKWLYCFTPFSTEPVGGKWPTDQLFKSSRSGLNWTTLKDPAPNDKAAERLRQMKGLFARFSASTTDEVAKQSYQLRALAKPLHEYTAPKQGVVQGILCGFVANGTNPDVVVALEAVRPPDKPDATLTWRYGVVGMTAFGVKVKLDDQEVYTRGYVKAPGDHETWTHFWEGEK
jgi:hypothetical protein